MSENKWEVFIETDADVALCFGDKIWSFSRSDARELGSRLVRASKLADILQAEYDEQ